MVVIDPFVYKTLLLSMIWCSWGVHHEEAPCSGLAHCLTVSPESPPSVWSRAAHLQRCSHTSHGGMLNKSMEITDTDCVKVSWLVINMTSSSESSGNLWQLWGEWSWSKLRQIVSKQCWYHTCLLRKGHNVLVCLCTLSGWKRRALDLA